jgi:glycerophosphoryl diester phosphodiesterase
MQKHPYFINSKVVILAHRGGTVPTENTIEAFHVAVDAGADIIETDIRATKDGIAVLFHDEAIERVVDWQYGRQYEEIYEMSAHKWDEDSVDRGLNAKKNIGPEVREFTLSQLKGIHLLGGTRVTTLAEALIAFPKMKFNIDVKAKEAIPDLVATVEKLKAHDRVLVSSFSNKRRLKALKQFTSPVATSGSASVVIKVWLFCLLGLPTSLVAKALENIGALQIPRRMSVIKLDSPRFMKKVIATGTQLHYWTINDPKEILELASLGASGIVTDVPELAVQTLRKA